MWWERGSHSDHWHARRPDADTALLCSVPTSAAAAAHPVSFVHLHCHSTLASPSIMLTRMRASALPRLHALTAACGSGGVAATGALLRPQHRPRALASASAERVPAALTARRFATNAPHASTAAPSATVTTATASASAGASGSSGKGGGSLWARRGAIAAAAAALLYAVSRSEERTLPPQPAKHIRGENKALQQRQYASAKDETAVAPAAPASRAAAIQAASLASALPASADTSSANSTSHVSAEDEEPSPSHPDHASCRACRDGGEETAYLQQQAAAAAGSAAGSSSDATASPAAASSSPSGPCPPCFAYSHSLCPLNRAEVGRASWGYLHTLAAYYPERPTQRQRDEMAELIRLFMKLYPCAYCADRSVEQIEREPIHLHNASQRDLAQWMCRAHNEVNERIGKPIFDCTFVDQRWRDGTRTHRDAQQRVHSAVQCRAATARGCSDSMRPAHAAAADAHAAGST